MTTTIDTRKGGNTRKQRKGAERTDRTEKRREMFFLREKQTLREKERERERKLTEKKFWPKNKERSSKEEEYLSFVSLLSWRDLRRIAARDKKTPLESARFGFKSNNNNTFLIIVSSIASPHPKVVRYSSHRAGRIERERERLYLRLREKTNGALLTKSSSLSSSWLLLLNDIIIDDDWRVVPIGFRAIVAEHTSEQPPRRRWRRRRCDYSSSSPVDRRRGRKHFKILF